MPTPSITYRTYDVGLVNDILGEWFQTLFGACKPLFCMKFSCKINREVKEGIRVETTM